MKDESISVRVDYETKQLYLRLQKEFNKTGPELIKFLLENCYASYGNIIKLNELDNAYSMVDDTHRMVSDIFSMLDTHLEAQKKSIHAARRFCNDGVGNDVDRMKRCMTSFLKTRSQHIGESGNYKHYFNVEEAKRRICEINGVSVDEFNHTLSLVDSGVSLDDALVGGLCRE